MKRKYPRATLRKIIRGKRSINLSKSVDIAVSNPVTVSKVISLTLFLKVFLSLVLALNRLAKAAGNKAQEGRETVITPRHIAAVAPVSCSDK